ncbi:hypothetical protein DTO96_100827 [Ephemeroptericola cinctiostellae]|uniref:O-antigen ligase-related domain-containing protein n=1 Tax=Ephemeroptericola cinctiostellae TaxID=2268024 RepID=A0A345D9S0_9BURK|nr:O-antigen ligase family protein [Ephemeroptericola cinctiostellae]AXF85108.1 hypothetical protein DTO96_100827 [Ephemeroptericola cinctiostellae]
MQTWAHMNRYDRIIAFVFLSIPLIPAGGEAALAVLGLFGMYVFFKSPRAFKKELSWTRRDQLIFLALSSVFILKLLSVMWADNPTRAIKNVLNNVHFLGWPFLLWVFMRASQPLQSLTRGVACGALAAAVWGCMWVLLRIVRGDLMTTVEPFEAGSQNAGVFAHIVCVYGLWLLYAWLNFKVDVQTKRALGMAFFAALIALLCSSRRIQLVIMVALASLVVLMHMKKNLNLRAFVSIAGLSGVVLALVVVWMAPKYEQAYVEATTFVNDPNPHGEAIQSSIGNRLEYYHIASSAIQAQPVLGYGAGTKPQQLERFSHDPASLSHFNHFHNQYFQTLVEVGVLGSLLAVWALLFLWREQVWRVYAQSPHVAVFFALIFSVYMLTGLFSIALSQGLLNSFFILSSAVLWAETRKTL